MQTRLDRDLVATLLRSQPDLRVLGLAATSVDAMALCVKLRPRVLILGTQVEWPPEVNGVVAIRLAAPETQILVVAPHGADRCALLNPADPPWADTSCTAAFPHATCLPVALAHGALGGVDRDASLGEFLDAVRTVAHGRHWMARDMGHLTGHAKHLSPQERKVARLVGQGGSNKDIARILGSSELTVKKQVGSILHKLGVHDRLQLGLAVARHPLLFDGD